MMDFYNSKQKLFSINTRERIFIRIFHATLKFFAVFLYNKNIYFKYQLLKRFFYYDKFSCVIVNVSESR